MTGAAFAQCSKDRIELRGDWGQAAFHVEIADTPQTQAKGLMFRKTMPKSAGMVFPYDPPQPVAFWMRNTLIPLDIIYLDAVGQVMQIYNAIPLDETPLYSDGDVALVLEINGGLADAIGISEGDWARYMTSNQQIALWPCEK